MSTAARIFMKGTKVEILQRKAGGIRWCRNLYTDWLPISDTNLGKNILKEKLEK
jgi:hypothetical protein